MPPTRRRTGRRAALAGLGLAAAALLLPGAALASPAGDLDPSFDRDGRRLLLNVKSAEDVLVQDDGKAAGRRPSRPTASSASCG